MGLHISHALSSRLDLEEHRLLYFDRLLILPTMQMYMDTLGDYPPPIDLTRLSFVTESDATEDSLPGPGRIVDRFLASWGNRLNGVFTWAARRLGLGPDAMMARALRRSAKLRTLPTPSSTCRHKGTIREALESLPSDANMGRILDYISASPALMCPSCRDRAAGQLVLNGDVRRACEKLVFLLKYVSNLIAFP
jgi:hypothetical protein